MAQPQVGILMGSDSDFDLMQETAKILKKFDIPFEMHVKSAHRSPQLVHDYVTQAAGRGIKVLICAAGGAAHLAGVAESLTELPVIGVPIAAGALNGLDALLATVQMPAGVPVGTVAVGKAGAANAAYFALKIIALTDPKVAAKVKQYKVDLAASVGKKDEKLQARLKEL